MPGTLFNFSTHTFIHVTQNDLPPNSQMTAHFVENYLFQGAN